MAKTSWVGTKENVGYSEFIDICNSVPEDIMLFENANEWEIEENFMNLVNYNDFVDYENGTCSFDSPDYINMLKFAKNRHIGLDNREFEEAHGGKGFFTYQDELAFLEDRSLFENQIQGWADVPIVFKGHFEEPVTVTGLPGKHIGYMNATGGSYSILRSAKEPQGAWEFIKLCFDDEYTQYVLGFNSIKKFFYQRMEEKRKQCYVDEETGETVSGGYLTVWTGGDYNGPNNADYLERVHYAPMPDEEFDRAEKIILDCARNCRYHDRACISILREELDEYFNSDRTAERTAEIIQNRMSIYMSERYG